MWPDLPRPVTISRPRAVRITSVAATKAGPSSDLSAAASAVTPPASASKVRNADSIAAFACSVMAGFTVRDLDDVMLCSVMGGKRCSGPQACLARLLRRCDAAPAFQRLINHNCFNSINDELRRRLGGPSRKYMFMLEFSNRDLGSSDG